VFALLRSTAREAVTDPSQTSASFHVSRRRFKTVWTRGGQRK